MVHSRTILVTGLAALLITSGGAAGADEKQVCSDAYVRGQELRSSRKLGDSRDALIVCASRACPEFMQSECSKWLEEVDASMPTLVIDVRDASGHSISAARLSIDGRVRAESLDGKALSVDPGERTIRVELANGQSLERRVIVREGEKNQKVDVAMDATAQLPTPAPVPVPVPVPPAKSHPFPIAGYIAGVLAVGAIASFAGFGISGLSTENNLKSTCGHRCAPSDVQALRYKYDAADISLGVAAVAAGAFLWIALSTPPKDSPSPLSGGAPRGMMMLVGHAF